MPKSVKREDAESVETCISHTLHHQEKLKVPANLT